MNTSTQTQKWYDNKVLLIILFFVLPPLGIYGMLKHKTDTWKKLLYIFPALGFILFTVIIFLGAIFMDSYKDGIDYYKKGDYIKAYDNLKMVKSDNPNYQEAIEIISEIKPIVDSLENQKRLDRENERLAKEETKNEIDSDSEVIEKEIQNPLPQPQQSFVTIIEQARNEYKDAPNELKKSVVRTKRGNLIKETLGNNRNFDNWIGIVKEMRTTGKGNAIFTLQIEGTKINFGTMNNEFSDMFDGTLIEQNNPLYNTIAELQKGDKVVVSGSFLPSDGNDYIYEFSLTEDGSMKNPEFLVRFKEISKL